MLFIVLAPLLILFTHTFTYFLPLCHYIYLCKFLFSAFRLIMTEERSKRREFLLLVFIVNCVLLGIDIPCIVISEAKEEAPE